MTTYEYLRLTDPDEATLSQHGAAGYRIVANYSDPKQTYTQVVIMEREQALLLVSETVTEQPNGTKRRRR